MSEDMTWEDALRTMTKRQRELEALIQTTRANLSDLSSVATALSECASRLDHIKEGAFAAMCEVDSASAPRAPSWYLGKVDDVVRSTFEQIDRLNTAVEERTRSSK